MYVLAFQVVLVKVIKEGSQKYVRIFFHFIISSDIIISKSNLIPA